jgi:acyl-CoA synthetase (AMP-forming)/AMP-acid ligase II
MCVQKSTPEQRAALDLRSWTLAFTGAEPIRYSTLERFVNAFAPAGFQRSSFYPCYGLAESTLMVTGGKRAAPPKYVTVDAQALEAGNVVQVSVEAPRARTFVGCGHVGAPAHVAIVDPDSRHRISPRGVGEIWVSHPSVAVGYWRQLEATAEAFGVRPVADVDDPATRERGIPSDGPFLRTGDLGFVSDGELFVTGRRKDLILVAGRNVYPLDLERAAEESHGAIRDGCSAAFTVEVGGEDRIVLVAEVDRSYSCSDGGAALMRGVQRAVLEREDVRIHQVVLLTTRATPKTSSGKVQRHACRTGFLENTLRLWEPSR